MSAGGAIGGAIGAEGGFWAGGAIGGAIGGLFGPEAIPLGARVGSAVGTWGGRIAGEAAGTWIASHMANANDKAKDKSKDDDKSKPCKGCDEADRKEKKKTKYKRPSGFRKGVRDKVWDDAKDANGEVHDPLTGEKMNEDEPWDMGHKPGYEFRKAQDNAVDTDMSRPDFLDDYNNPDHYRPELPSSNRSHQGEDMSDTYLGS